MVLSGRSRKDCLFRLLHDDFLRCSIAHLHDVDTSMGLAYAAATQVVSHFCRGLLNCCRRDDPCWVRVTVCQCHYACKIFPLFCIAVRVHCHGRHMERGIAIRIIKNVAACFRHLFGIVVHVFQACSKERSVTDTYHTIGYDNRGKVTAIRVFATRCVPIYFD